MNYDEVAREIVESWRDGTEWNGGVRNGSAFDVLTASISAALAAAHRVPEGHVRQGVTDLPIDGWLPISEDGWILGVSAKVWEVVGPPHERAVGLGQGRFHVDDEWESDEDLRKWGRGFYHDREAAEAAKGVGDG